MDKLSILTSRITSVLSDMEFPEAEWAAALTAVTGRIGNSKNTPKVPPLPDKAPELYRNRPTREDLGRRETVIEFLERVYDPWIKADVAALNRTDLRRLDPGAEIALRNWLYNHNKLPDGMAIPTKTEIIDRMADSGSLPEPDLARVGQALARRHQRRNKPERDLA